MLKRFCLLCGGCTNSTFYHSQGNNATHCKLSVNIAFKGSLTSLHNNVTDWTVRNIFKACERIKDLVTANLFYSCKSWEKVEPFNRAKLVSSWFLFRVEKSVGERLGCQPGMCGILVAVRRHLIPEPPLLAQGCTWDLWELLLLGSGASSLSAVSPLQQPFLPICNLQKFSKLPGTKISSLLA